MKKALLIVISSIVGIFLLWIMYMLILFAIESYKIANDPTLYNGFKIIEQKTVTAEDGLTFYTLQVDMNHPKTPYRLYVFTSDDRKEQLFFEDSYMDRIVPEVALVYMADNIAYYQIESQIIKHNNGKFQTKAAKSLDYSNPLEKNNLDYVPVIKKLVEQGSWFWLHEGAEFLLKSEEKAYITDVLSNFETNNKEKTEYSEPYYRGTLTYEKMASKCNELLQKYGSLQ